MEDRDLAFLKECNNDSLRLLADTIVYDKVGAERFTEQFSGTDIYKENYPNHMVEIVPRMVDEIQRYGGNTFFNMYRGHGVTYREILEQVASRLKVNYNKSNSTELIEQYLLQHILIMSIDKMTEEDLKHFSEKYSKADLKAKIGLLEVGSPLFIRLTGIIVLQLSKRFAQNTVLGILSKLVGGRAFAFLTGPIGWVLSGMWAAFDVAGPAYRVLIPCTITVAYLRQIKDKTDEEMENIFSR